MVMEHDGCIIKQNLCVFTTSQVFATSIDAMSEYTES